MSCYLSENLNVSAAGCFLFGLLRESLLYSEERVELNGGSRVDLKLFGSYDHTNLVRSAPLVPYSVYQTCRLYRVKTLQASTYLQTYHVKWHLRSHLPNSRL